MLSIVGMEAAFRLAAMQRSKEHELLFCDLVASDEICFPYLFARFVPLLDLCLCSIYFVERLVQFAPIVIV